MKSLPQQQVHILYCCTAAIFHHSCSLPVIRTPS